MATGDYITLEEFKDWVSNLSDSFDDLNLAGVITAVSRGIDQYCCRHFYQETETRYFDAESRWMLDLGRYRQGELLSDLVSITTLRTDGDADGVFEITWSASDYQLLPRNPGVGAETRPYRKVKALARNWPTRWSPTQREGLIEIAGVWGWPAVPEAVKQACKLRTHQVFKRRETPEGVAGFGEFGVIRVSRFKDPDIAELLDPYRHPSAVALVA